MNREPGPNQPRRPTSRRTPEFGAEETAPTSPYACAWRPGLPGKPRAAAWRSPPSCTCKRSRTRLDFVPAPPWAGPRLPAPHPPEESSSSQAPGPEKQLSCRRALQQSRRSGPVADFTVFVAGTGRPLSCSAVTRDLVENRSPSINQSVALLPGSRNSPRDPVSPAGPGAAPGPRAQGPRAPGRDQLPIPRPRAQWVRHPPPVPQLAATCGRKCAFRNSSPMASCASSGSTPWTWASQYWAMALSP